MSATIANGNGEYPVDKHDAHHAENGHGYEQQIDPLKAEKVQQAEAVLQELHRAHDDKWEKKTIRLVDVRLLIILGLCYAVSLM